MTGWQPNRLGWTPCRDGAVVSTVDFSPYADAETAVFVDKSWEIVEKYDDVPLAIAGHARHVRTHFGPLNWFWRFLLNV
jgi:hypothetical protein